MNDNESGFYYLQSRYYDPKICRFINADGYTSTGQGILGHNMFAYCLNNPICCIDISGTRGSVIWSFDNDKVGRQILAWYLYGDGAAFPSNEEHSDYLKENKLLKEQVQKYLYEIAGGLAPGESVSIDDSISVIIENGEDIIGYQYLHGTNADAGGFHIEGTINKLSNGDCIFDLSYTWNDIIDPNPQYSSDMKKAKFAEYIPFANPSNYTISITWADYAVLPAGGVSSHNKGSGWLVSN